MTSAAQQSHSVDVLVERVTRLVDDVEGLRDDIRNQTATLGKIPVIEHELANIDKKVAGAFKAIDEAEQSISGHAQSITEGRTLYRFMSWMSGLAVTITVAGVGWFAGQLISLNRANQEFNVRLVTMEVRSIANSQSVSNLQNAAPQRDADKLNKGWTRERN